MESSQVESSRPTEQAHLSHVVQAHLGRASWFADGKTRNWALFFFFRIMTDAEIDKDVGRLTALMGAADAESKKMKLLELLGSLEDPALMNARFVAPAAMSEMLKKNKSEKKAPTDSETQRDNETVIDTKDRLAPAQLFLAWLKLLTDKDSKQLGPTLRDLFLKAGIPISAPRQALELEGAQANMMMRLLHEIHGKQAGAILSGLHDLSEDNQITESLLGAFTAIFNVLSDPDEFVRVFEGIADTASTAGLRALSLGLPGVCGYELLRQIAPAYYPKRQDLSGIVRSEINVGRRPEEPSKQRWDPVPINFTFTHAGLNALQLDATTLASFPEAFKDGMASRAERLGDTGPSAPEHWYGALGLQSIHGYFTGGFLVGDEDNPAAAQDWQSLRDDVRAFNDRSPSRGRLLRLILGAFFRSIGLEIMHIELGEDPFDVDKDGHVRRLPYRKEHFGFRDGISQPFLDLELEDPPPGGGTPDRDRTWSPVAPGEIYLNRPDEDGNEPQQPLPPLLREGSTFVVFRKLEQDVPGFRMFLGKQRPGDQKAQTKLASQFVGRWRNGTPLVLAPDAPLDLGDDPDGLMNNFLYAADDPDGANCPLGAHVRRTNPRDIGGTNDVRRHRILRRSIGYGGALLPHEKLGDGNPRGLLFIAVNSRIDLQFEVIQANWINRGELLGQAGLGRCPVTGANLGGPSDTFLEAGAVAPVVGLPRFVITRGGDYFFAPGLNALKAIANGCKFELPPDQVPYLGYSMGDTKTPTLFDADRLYGYAIDMLFFGSIVRVTLPPTNSQDPEASPVVFVGQHAHVSRVLSTVEADTKKGKKIIYSVAQYQEAGRRISRGYDLIIGTEPGSDTAEKHQRMHALLDDAWDILRRASPNFYARLQGIIKRNIEAALRRTGPSKRIDMVHDLPSTAVYEIVTDIFGTPGPDWLTEIAIALPFARQHFGELHPDWLAALKGAAPDNPSLATMQIWSILLFADIVGNYDHQQELMGLSLQAGSEFLTQLDTLLTVARSQHGRRPGTMMQAFVELQGEYMRKYPKAYASSDNYYAEVRMLLMELAGSAIAIIPTAFGSIMDSLLDFGIDLSRLIPILLAKPNFTKGDSALQTGDGITRLIYETTRLKPTFQILMRRCAHDDDLNQAIGPTIPIKKGEWVAALVAAADFDPKVFEDPMAFSLAPFVPGPDRDLTKYLLFGAQGGHRECWGRDRLALQVLKECVKAAGRLQGLRRVAGAAGELQQPLPGVNIGLNARFAFVLPDWPPASTS
jgi:Dyp-type peroxidase family